MGCTNEVVQQNAVRVMRRLAQRCDVRQQQRLCRSRVLAFERMHASPSRVAVAIEQAHDSCARHNQACSLTRTLLVVRRWVVIGHTRIVRTDQRVHTSDICCFIAGIGTTADVDECGMRMSVTVVARACAHGERVRVSEQATQRVQTSM